MVRGQGVTVIWLVYIVGKAISIFLLQRIFCPGKGNLIQTLIIEIKKKKKPAIY